MTRKSFSLFYLLVLYLTLPRQAQGSAPDTIRWDGPTKKIDIVKKGVVLATKEELGPGQAWRLLLQGAHHDQKATVGFTDKIYWIAFTYKNETTGLEEKILEIDNPHIDWLNVYTLDSLGNFKLLVETGDKLLFSTRPIRHRNFAVPLSFAPGETRTVLIKIDKRNSSLSFPTYLWDKESFYSKYFTQNLWFGLFFGIIVLCLFYALMTFIFLRKALYGWYFVMVLISTIYLFTAFGLSFQYVYPHLLGYNNLLRPYLIVALFICTTKFSQHYLRLDEHQPSIHIFLNYLLVVAVMMAAAYPFAIDFMTKNGAWFVSSTYLISCLGFLSYMYAAVRSYHKQRATVLFYFSAWGMLLIAYVLVISSEFGLIPVESFRVNPVLIGSSLEMFIFSIGLTYQISKIYNERNKLSLAMARQQKDLLKAYVDGTEKERQRVSRELHDDIGSRLGSLKRFITGNEHHNTTLEKQIDILCQDVRNLSHQLAPNALEISDFRQLINQLLKEVSGHEELKTEVQFYDIPKTLSPEITHHLFRMTQEALNNVLKHAHATELDLQFFGYENEIVMTIEDNGRGFDPILHAGGIGLRNMKARAESVNGTIEINSTPGNGTSVMIRIPV